MADAAVYFLVQSTRDLPEDEFWLAANEASRAASMRFPKRRRDWVLGRWTAKMAIRNFLIQGGNDVPGFAELEIRSAPDGAPEPYVHGTALAVSISLSHSGDSGFCAVAAGGITLGSDLELIQSHEPQFIEDYLVAEEGAVIRRAPQERQALLTTLIWSAKESALKCLREGLRRDTRSVRIDVCDAGDGEWNPFTAHCLETQRIFPGWWRPAGPCVQTIASSPAAAIPRDLARCP